MGLKHKSRYERELTYMRRSQAAVERWARWRREGYHPCRTPQARHNMSEAAKQAWRSRRAREAMTPKIPAQKEAVRQGS
jgi:hypothetical protein